MGNKRLYEVAKEIGKSANEVIEVLKKHNIEKGNFSGMDEKAIVAWMKDGYGHRDGLEKFTEFCANRNNSTVSNIFYD